MEIELWKDVKGYEGYYQVSNLGRVKSLDRIDSMGRLWKGKILSQINNGNGYVKVGFTINKKEKKMYVHRLVAEAFISNPQNKPEVNHIDGNKQNNCVSNLEWVTSSENDFHAYRTGLNTNKGENNTNSKLSKEKVDWIREHYIKGDGRFGCHSLAKKFGVSFQTINKITLNKTWKEED